MRNCTSAAFRRYLREHVEVVVDGLLDTDGLIAEAHDEATGLVDKVMTVNNILTLHGYGLKIEGDASHAAEVGLFFQLGENPPIKADVIAVNEPRTLKAVVPAALLPGGLGPAPAYTVKIVTQSSARTNKQLLKNVREMHAEFTLTPQA